MFYCYICGDAAYHNNTIRRGVRIRTHTFAAFYSVIIIHSLAVHDDPHMVLLCEKCLLLGVSSLTAIRRPPLSFFLIKTEIKVCGECSVKAKKMPHPRKQQCSKATSPTNTMIHSFLKNYNSKER